MHDAREGAVIASQAGMMLVLVREWRYDDILRGFPRRAARNPIRARVPFMNLQQNKSEYDASQEIPYPVSPH